MQVLSLRFRSVFDQVEPRVSLFVDFNDVIGHAYDFVINRA